MTSLPMITPTPAGNYAPAANVASVAGLLPVPAQVEALGGVFALAGHVSIVADPNAHFESGFLASRISEMTGLTANTTPGAGPQIRMAIDEALDSLGVEGYRLRVAAEGVTIFAPSLAGLYYGAQTFLQLIPRQAVGGVWEIPAVAIEDAPRFAWRGAMLDVSRHYMPFDFLLRFVDQLAAHKLNVLHLHLTDDQGWRMEIKKHPRLTQIGAYRKKTLVGHAKRNPNHPEFDPSQEVFDGEPHAGFYTQDEMRRLVAYAAERHVTVVPEIEMPGHAQAAVAAYPEYGCVSEPVEVSPRWGIHSYLFNVAEETFTFLQDVLAEVVDVFPSRYIHVGGDEAVKTQWKQNEAVQQRMRELGVGDEQGMQAYFIGRMDSFLTAKGRVLIGWDEILQGGLAPNAAVMSWRGEEGGINAAGKGHDVVMAPHTHLYLDYYQSEDREREPLAFPSVVTLAKIYDYDIVPKELSADRAHRVLGAQSQLWTEYMPDEKQVEYMAFPRLCALAERTWSPQETKDYPGFVARLKVHERRLEAMGVNYRPV